MLYKSLFYSALAMMLALQVNADPVWKVTDKTGSRVYLGGTIHLLASEDHPLPKAFEIAYQDSGSLIFETDMDGANSLTFQTKMMRAMMYQDGRTLKSELSPAVFAEIEAYLAKQGLPASNFLSFTPVGFTLFISVSEIQKLGMEPQYGVDATFHGRGKAEGKSIGQLETLDEQLAFIVSMGGGDNDSLVSYTFRDLKLLPSMMGQLKEAWRAGDLTAFNALAIDEMKKDYPTMYESLLLKRNRNWLPQLEAMFKEGGTEFVLVGALHLAGEHGLIEQLRGKGYRVEQL